MIGIHVTNGARVGQFEDIVTPPDWSDAACRGHAPELWFPETRGGSGDTYATARAICDGCPLKDTCLEYSLSRETASYRYGMWGGLDPNERSVLARERRRTER